MGISLRRLVVKLLNDGTDPNDIFKAIEETIGQHGEWAKWGDGRWRRDTVCSICGSDYPGICGHQDNPEQRVVLRTEYDEFLKTVNPIKRMGIGEKDGKGDI